MKILHFIRFHFDKRIKSLFPTHINSHILSLFFRNKEIFSLFYYFRFCMSYLKIGLAAVYTLAFQIEFCLFLVSLSWCYIIPLDWNRVLFACTEVSDWSHYRDSMVRLDYLKVEIRVIIFNVIHHLIRDTIIRTIQLAHFISNR